MQKRIVKPQKQARKNIFLKKLEIRHSFLIVYLQNIKPKQKILSKMIQKGF